MPYVPTDAEADELLTAVEAGGLDETRMAKAKEMLGTYKQAKVSAGLQPFQPDPVAQRATQARLDAFYGGLDTVEAQLPVEQQEAFKSTVAMAPDPQEAKARIVNQSWVIGQRPELARDVDADWETVKRQVAQQIIGTDKPNVSDAELYTGISAHLTKKQERVAAAEDMLGKLQDAAFTGEADFMTAFQKVAAPKEGDETTPAERDAFRAQAEQVFAHAAERVQTLRPLADQLMVSLSRETGAREGFEGFRGVDKAELIPTIAELSSEDRALLYRMMAQDAKTSPEAKDGQDKGAVAKVAERFGRQVRDLAMDQIASFENSNLAHAIAVSDSADNVLVRGERRSGESVLEFAERTAMGNRGIVDFVSDVVTGTPSAEGLRNLTYSEKAELLTSVQQMEEQYRVALELKDIAENVVDPTKFDNRILDALASAPGQLAYSAQAALPWVGIPLLVNSTKAMRTREFVQRGVPMAQANEMASASALVEAPIEWVQSKMLFGKVPGVAEALTKPLTTDSLSALGKRAATLFAAEYGLQNVQEAAQDVTPLLIQEIVSNWGEGVPEVTKADWLQFADSRIDTAITLLPITLLGTGVATFKDGAYGRAYVQNREVLKAAGFTDAAVEQIVAQPTFEGKQQAIEGMWSNPQMRSFGTPEQQEAAAQIDAENEGNVQGMPDASRNTDGTYTVRDEAGQAIDTTDTPEAATALARAQPVTEGMEPQAAPLGLNMPNATTVAFAPRTDQRVSAPQVMDSFSQIMRSVGEAGEIRVGRFGRRKALGSYWVREQMTRIRTANDVTTAAHEVAHALEDVLYGAGNVWSKNQAVPVPARAELEQLGRDLYGSKKPQGGYHSEGFAEFNRLYLTDPAQAQAKAPGFFAFWEAELAKRPKLLKAVQSAQNAAQTWFQQGSIGRAEQGIAQQPTRLENLKETVAEQRGQFYRRFIEAAAAIEDFTKEAVERGGKGIKDADNPMVTLTARRLTADSVVDYMANKGMLDFAGNVVGKPLVEAFQLVKDNQADFLLYLWAKRAVALWNDPNGARNPGLAREDAAFIVNELETPQFQQAAQVVYQWNDGVLDYAAEASPDFAKTVDAIRKADPGFYIPLYREFEAFDERAKGSGGVKGKNLVAKLKGSGRRIKDPVESMLQHAKAIVLKAQQKRVLDQIIRIADSVPGLGNYVFEVPADQVPSGAQTLQDVIDRADKAVRDLGGKGVKVQGIQAMQKAGVDLNAEVMTFFAPAYQPKQNENPILPIYKDGKVHWYEMDQDLYAALSGMDTYRLPKALDMLFGIPARTFRLGTTGLRASFSLVTNPIRDFRTLMLNSRASANTPKLFFDWLGMLKDTAIGALTAGKGSNPWVDLAERLGIEMAQPLGQDSRPLQRAARRLKRGGEFRAWDPRDQYDFVLGLFQFTETAARLTEIKNVAEDLGWDPSQPLTADIAAKLAVAGKQVTTDFTQAGSVARSINQAVPFFNAGIQGPVAHLRAVKADPTKFAIRGLMLTAAALAVWWRNKDEDWWKEMPLKERYGFTYIPVGDELIRIPRAFEADGLFMAGAEALADAWYQEDPKAAAEWFGKWLGSFSQIDTAGGVPVPPMPVLMQMAAEQLANRDFFSDSSIVPKGQEDLADAEQFSPYTSRAAIKIGSVFDVSPRRVDHAINSIFGGVGSDLVALLGRGNKDLVEREKEGADLPVFGVLFQRGGQQARSPESVEKLYDIYEEALKIQRSRFQEESLQDSQKRLMVSDAIRAVTILEDVKLLTASRAARAELDAEQISIARDVVKAVEEGRIDRGMAMSARGRATARQYQTMSERGITARPRDTRPLRTFASQPDQSNPQSP